ncbi:MAG TPA: cation diffusion facilitator family transporter [Longimicrobiales bacterium]|nr:cation diffusion facilitator family transporter [Longimicrobiales bacterium]
MRTRPEFDLPADLEPVMRRARRLEWATLAAMAVIVAAVYATMGNSQAMKAAWVEDLLSFVAPIAFLVSARYRHRPPNEEFPYGYHRSASIAFLAGSVALALFGAYILLDSAWTLLSRHHPTVGTSVVLGRQIWSGWMMMGVLFLSGIPPMVLGRLKMSPARLLHDKTLKADADMNRADWLTAVAGIVGLVGIGVGWWWADAVAGGAISVSIVRDGATNLREVVSDLMDARPKTVEGDVSTAPARVEEALGRLAWVERAEVRLREEGHVFAGEAWILARSTAGLAAKIEEARQAARMVDWRVHDLVVEVSEAQEARPAIFPA